MLTDCRCVDIIIAGREKRERISVCGDDACLGVVG